MVCKCCPMLPKFGQKRPKHGQVRTEGVDVGQKLASGSRRLAYIDQCCSNPVRLDAKLASLWPASADVGRIVAEVPQTACNMAQIGQDLAEFGPQLGSRHNC